MNELLKVYKLIILIILIKQTYNFTKDEIEKVLIKAKKDFIHNFFNYTLDEGCSLDDYMKNIYEYSFLMQNNLGDYSGCINEELKMKYLFFIYLNNDINNNETPDLSIDNGFSYYFKDLIFTQYFLFSMCVPKCISFSEDTKNNPLELEHEKDLNYTLRIYDVQNIYKSYVEDDITIKHIIFSIYFIFLILSIFFALIPSYDKLGSILTNLITFCFCRSKKKVEIKNQSEEEYSVEVSNNVTDENLKALLKRDNTRKTGGEYYFEKGYNHSLENADSLDKSEHDDLSFERRHQNIKNELIQDSNLEKKFEKNKKRNFYKLFTSIFSISKNIRRMFKINNKQTIQQCSYINDNSIKFINGLRGINIICLSYCTIFSIFLQSPNSITNYRIKEQIYKEFPIIFPILYYMCWSLYLTYAYDGFKLGYKFLYHMHRIENSQDLTNRNSLYSVNNKKATIKKILTFILPQLYYYPLYVFLFFNVYNLHNLLNINTIDEDLLIPGYDTGPLFYIYKEISNYTYERLNYFLLLYANFQMEDLKLTKNSIYIFFFFFINEIQYFFILLVILIIYYLKPSLGIILLSFSYISIAAYRSVCINFNHTSHDTDIENNSDVKEFFGIEIYRLNFILGLPVYIIGVIFGVFYFEYNIVDTVGVINNKILSNDSFNSKSIDLNFSQFIKYAVYNRNHSRKFIKYLGSNRTAQIILFSVIFIIFISFIFLDNFVLFPSIRETGFLDFKYDGIQRIYTFFEIDFLTIIIFLFVFKFAIFSNKSLRKLLQSNFWIPLSRLYLIIFSLLSPLTYYIILNLEYSIIFNFSNATFFSISLIVFLFILSFIITLIIEVPLKVCFKKITNRILID